MKLHPRTRQVAEARNEIGLAWLKLGQKYDLTYIERIKVLNELIAEELRYAIRTERHPNEPDKGGDEA